MNRKHYRSPGIRIAGAGGHAPLVSGHREFHFSRKFLRVMLYCAVDKTNQTNPSRYLVDCGENDFFIHVI